MKRKHNQHGDKLFSRLGSQRPPQEGETKKQPVKDVKGVSPTHTAMSVSTLAGRAVGQGERRYAKKGQAPRVMVHFVASEMNKNKKCENLSAIEIIALVQVQYGPNNQLDLTNKGIGECLRVKNWSLGHG